MPRRVAEKRTAGQLCVTLYSELPERYRSDQLAAFSLSAIVRETYVAVRARRRADEVGWGRGLANTIGGIIILGVEENSWMRLKPISKIRTPLRIANHDVDEVRPE